MPDFSNVDLRADAAYDTPIPLPSLRVHSMLAGPSTVLTLSSVTPSVGYLDVAFSADIGPLVLEASLPEKWAISGPTPITTTSATIVSSNVVRIYHSEPIGGASYTLTMPANGIQTVPGDGVYNGVGSVVFVAAATVPVVLTVFPLDGKRFRLQFSEPVVASEALVPGNYAISPTLTPTAVEIVSSSEYIVTTQQSQGAGVVYTVTVTGVHDLAGNLI